jgi:hypothetical protein
MTQVRMGFDEALLAAAMAISTQVAAQAPCDPAAGLTFICGLTNAEDLVRVPGTPWIVASGLAGGENTQGHVYFVNARDRTVEVLLPGHVVNQQDTTTFGACPGVPDETKFSADGLSLRVGSQSEHTLYVVRHGERESVEVFKLKTGPVAPTLTWVGCVAYPAGVMGNGVTALPDGALAASNFMSTNDPKAVEKLMAGQPEGGVLVWRPKTGWEHLFVAGSGDESVVRVSIDGTPGPRAVIKTGFHTDNLRWGADGFLYAAGRRDTVQNLLARAPNTKQRCTSPFFCREDQSRDA